MDQLKAENDQLMEVMCYRVPLLPPPSQECWTSVDVQRQINKEELKVMKWRCIMYEYTYMFLYGCIYNTKTVIGHGHMDGQHHHHHR